MEWWSQVQDWFWSLGDKYQVNPLIFGAIYVGAIPFFFLSLSWLIRNIRSKKSVVVPVLLTGFFFISAYLYLIIAGENIPLWVYFVIAALVGYGAFSTYRKVVQNVDFPYLELFDCPKLLFFILIDVSLVECILAYSIGDIFPKLSCGL